jgi:antitoxin MazE
LRTIVRTWGNSLAIRLPRVLAEDVGIGADTPVDISVEDGSLVVTPVEGRKKRLNKLVSMMTTDSVHSEDDFGKPVGREPL